MICKRIKSKFGNATVFFQYVLYYPDDDFNGPKYVSFYCEYKNPLRRRGWLFIFYPLHIS